MKKRFTSLMTTLILSVFFAISASAYDVEVNGIYYDIDGNTAKVTFGDKGYSGEIVIPESITLDNIQFGVKSIGDKAFYNCSGLTSVTIPNSVTTIGVNAFSQCSGLTSINIPNSVTRIEKSAFYCCSGLTYITIPDSITTIEHLAFYGCSGLTSISIPNSVTSIGDWAFHECSGLTNITIPNSVTTIGDYAFQECNGLTNITIPNSVTTIGDNAFSQCSGLTSINIPNSVTSIGDGAFAGCSGLTSINIPNSVTSIGKGILYGCENIKKTIIVNDSFVFLPQRYEGHYSIPNNVSDIIGDAFSGCTGLTSVTISNSVKIIGESSFYNCRGLTSVSIPNSVTSIGDGAFAGCSGLTSVSIPNSVTRIGSGAFNYCSSLKTLYYDCSANPYIGSNTLRELYIGDNTSIVYDYFKYLPLRKISLGKNVSQIRAEAFASSNIEEFTITGEEPPYLYPNVFGTQDLSNATLYVPESKTEYYQTTEPWSKFGKILTLSGETPSEPEKCATPSISFSDGKLQFTCETEGAEYYYTLNNSDVKMGETLAESNNVNLSACYDITFYAKSEGFVNSDVATAKLYWLPSSGTLETANINTAVMRGIAIQSAGGFINISGLDTNEKVDFYATDGKTLGSATAINGSVSFTAQQGTIIIAKIGKESVKIAVE